MKTKSKILVNLEKIILYFKNANTRSLISTLGFVISANIGAVMDAENAERQKKHDNESAADLERVTGWC